MEFENLKSLFDEYIEYKDVKEYTKNSYKKSLLVWYDYIKVRSIKSPKRNDVLNYKTYLFKKDLGSASIQRHLGILSGFYRYCKAHDYYDDITYEVKGVKISPTFKKQALSIPAAKKLIKRVKQDATTVQGKRNYAMIVLLLATGIRSNELVTANVEDIDLIGSDYIIRVKGKGRDEKDSPVKLSTEVYEILEDYLIERNNDHDALFITHHLRFGNHRISNRRLREIVKEYLILIGYDSKAYSTHSLRHTFATTALTMGATIYETKGALRHKDISTTQIYVQGLEMMNSDTHIKVSDAIFKKEK